VQGTIESEDALRGTTPWVNDELRNFAGDLMTCTALVKNGGLLRITNVHSPAWPIDENRMAAVDTSGIKLNLNKDVWVSDILWDSLRTMLPDTNVPWVVAGDFNLSETFDSWKGGPRGNAEYLKRMDSLGLVECLRKWNGELTATYLNKDRKGFVHQIDHMFVTKELAGALTQSVVGPQEDILEHRLSDHLPIIGDFNTPG
jgi:endonuclease/exonuclease/phosphatase family metal-dependent hydrolase